MNSERGNSVAAPTSLFTGYRSPFTLVTPGLQFPPDVVHRDALELQQDQHVIQQIGRFGGKPGAVLRQRRHYDFGGFFPDLLCNGASAAIQKPGRVGSLRSGGGALVDAPGQTFN